MSPLQREHRPSRRIRDNWYYLELSAAPAPGSSDIVGFRDRLRRRPVIKGPRPMVPTYQAGYRRHLPGPRSASSWHGGWRGLEALDADSTRSTATRTARNVEGRQGVPGGRGYGGPRPGARVKHSEPLSENFYFQNQRIDHPGEGFQNQRTKEPSEIENPRTIHACMHPLFRGIMHL